MLLEVYQHRKNFNVLHLGMTKAEVVEKVGNCNSSGAIRQEDGTLLEGWKYPVIDQRLKTGSYMLYFVGEKLVQFGELGDWSKQPDNIQEIRFR